MNNKDEIITLIIVGLFLTNIFTLYAWYIDSIVKEYCHNMNEYYKNQRKNNNL